MAFYQAEKICKNCNLPFMAKAHNTKYCPECKQKLLEEKKKKPKPIKTKDINVVLRKMREYNEENGTYLTYGQYVSLTETKRGF